MRRGRNIVLLFSIFLKGLNVEASVLKNSNVPTTTKEIKFELEVTDSLKVDPVYLDFGNILKNSSDLRIAQSYFDLSGTFKKDMLITTSYSEGDVEGDYTKIQLVKNENGVMNILEVYLKNLKSKILSSGEYKVPIVGEIRKVGDISLGKYEKTIKMNVEIQPISPTT